MPPSSSQGLREDDRTNKENKTGTSSSGATLSLASPAVVSPHATLTAPG